jgi:hypothetical protein
MIADEPDKAAPLTLTSGADPELWLVAATARDATATPAAAQALTSVHTWELACEVHEGDVITADLPHVPAEVRAVLGANGCAPPGTACEEGTLLVGKLTPRKRPLTPDEVVRASTSATEVLADRRDTSLRCPAGVRGVVKSVTVGKDDVTVTVVAQRPLRVGDVLRTERGEVAVVGAVVPELFPTGASRQPADVAWPGLAIAQSGRIRISKIACAEDLLEARATGPYSLITQTPLGGGKQERAGQRVGGATIDSLLSRGASVLVHELLTVKSSDVEGRARLQELLASGAEIPSAWGVPDASRVLERELWSLGLRVDFDAPAPALSLATTATVRALAPGIVRKPETLNYRSLKPEPGGLFCEDIFGGIETKLDRRRRLGRIELPLPVLHPWAVPTVAALLGRTEDEVWRVLTGDPDGDAIPGVVALKTALDAVDLDGLARRDGAARSAAESLLAAGLRPADLMLEAWPVLPPDLRPLVALGRGRFATSDLNDLYRRVINRANRLRRLMELDAPAIILFNEAKMVQQAVTSLVQNGLRGATLHDPEQRPLKSLADMVGGEGGRFQHLLQGSRVDYSGAAVVVERPDLSPPQALVPRDAAFALWMPWAIHALTRGQATASAAAKRLIDDRHPSALEALSAVTGRHPLLVVTSEPAPRVTSVEVRLWDEAALALPPATIAALALSPGDRVALHVPLSAQAKDEARGLRVAAPGPRAKADAGEGWIARATRAGIETIGALLYEAALRREADDATSTASRVVLGRRPGASPGSR